ncbi:MAG: prolipoprotein diacylglyceryl transferase [Planctomycetes bacterium]|nr:prolipoprotein diacylglyceryl transferase [Planctomycetota bacterium]
MYPELFPIPVLNWPINSYGFMIMVGFLLATYLGVRRGRELGIKSDLILDIGIISMIFGIIGAKINYVLQYSEQFRPPNTPSDAFRVFDFGDGGLNALGAVILGPLPWVLWFWRARKEPPKSLWAWQNGVLLVLTLFCALLGTRALYLALHPKDYDWSIFTGWQSGFVLYGGLITAVLAGALYTKMRGESVTRVSDMSAPLIMLGLAFGRVGCFLNGCCYGAIWHGFLAVRYPANSAVFKEHLQAGKLQPGAAHSEPVIPTQLLETTVALALFFLLSWYERKKKRNAGETVLLMGIGYAVWRFIVEFLRDDPRPLWLGELTYSQTVSLGVFILCAVGYFFVRTRSAAPPAGLASEAAAPPPAQKP